MGRDGAARNTSWVSTAATHLQPWPDVPFLDEHPFFAPQTRWVLQHCGIIDPTRIDEYIARGGFQAFAKAIRDMTPVRSASWCSRAACGAVAAAGFPPGANGNSPWSPSPSRST